MPDDPRELTNTGLIRRLARRRREVETAERNPDVAGGPVMLAARYRELERLEREAARRRERVGQLGVNGHP